MGYDTDAHADPGELACPRCPRNRPVSQGLAVAPSSSGVSVGRLAGRAATSFPSKREFFNDRPSLLCESAHRREVICDVSSIGSSRQLTCVAESIWLLARRQLLLNSKFRLIYAMNCV